MAITVETLKVAIEQTGGKKAATSLKNVAIASASAFVAIKALTKWIKKSNEAWAVQEKALIKTKSALRASGQEVLTNTRNLENFASALQAVTNVGDEVILDLAAQAVAMGATAKEAETATEMAIGLSEALGVGQTEALKKVLEATYGEVSAMQELIPELRSVTDETEAWEIINATAEGGLESLGAQVDTLNGQLKGSKNSIGDFNEQIGRFISMNQDQPISKFAEAMNKLTGFMKQNNDELELFNSLTIEQQTAIQDTGMTYEDYQRNLELTAYWTARMAAASRDLNDELAKLAADQKTADSIYLELANGLQLVTEKTEVALFAQTEYDAEKERSLLVQKALNDLVEEGFTVESGAIQHIITKYGELIQVKEIALEKETSSIGAIWARQDAWSAAVAQQKTDELELTRIAEEENKKRVESTLKYTESILSSFSSVFNGISALVSNSYQNQIDAAEEGSAKQKDLLEKQWVAEKAFAVTQSLISTALGITKAIPNIPLMIFAGAAGALQTAAILSQQKPAFADGTPVGGYVVPNGYNGDNYPVMAKSGETVNISRAGEGGGDTQITFMLDTAVLARVTTNLIENRKITIRTSDLVAS